jgi:gamma-F420-2:alpha-L-glutamate ligase
MRALVIVNGYYENSNNTYKAKRLSEEFSRYGVRVDVKNALALLPLAKGDTLSVNSLSSYDFAIDMDKDIYLAQAVEKKIPLFNSYRSLVLSDDKMTTIQALYGAGVRVPLTIPAPLCYIDDPSPLKIQVFLDQVEKALGYPLVFKECHGSLGRQVRLIHDRKELDEVYAENIKVPHLYEKFLSVHAGHDYRVMVVGKKVVAVMERINEHDFRSNIALGGKGYDATGKVPKAYEELALKATAALSLDYAGIDVAIGNDSRPYFLEANGNAFFTEIEKVTGVNVTRLLVEHILKQMKAKKRAA